jgi:hypothetical protein
MKILKNKLFLIGILSLFSTTLFANPLFETAEEFIAKKVLKKSEAGYTKDETKALIKLSEKYGKNAKIELENIEKLYGKEGIKLVEKYGPKVVKDKYTFEIVKKYGDRGFYLIDKYPQIAELYKRYGDDLITVINKYGAYRIINYIEEADKYNAGEKVLTFIKNFGNKAVEILEKHWKKFLVSGFILLHPDSITDTIKELGTQTIKTAGNTISNLGKDTVETVGKTTTNILEGRMGIFAGIAIILFVILKFGPGFFKEIKTKNNDDHKIS